MKFWCAWIAVVGLLGCEKDNDGAVTEPMDDAAAVDAAPALDQGPELDAALGPDATVLPDAAVPDAMVSPADQGTSPCDEACTRFADCSVDLCPGFEAPDRAALVAGCSATCAANPAFANVINGAGTCDTVVDFGRDQGDAAYVAACRPGQDPLVPDGTECPYPCQGDEVCNQGQCVRPDGTCETDYHCRLGELCEGGMCHTGQFAECRAELDCTGEGQTCRSFSQNPLDPGTCFFGCGEDTDCPLSESCNRDAGNICYYEFCGPATPNGRLFGECRIGPWAGTCYPLAEGNATPQGTAGLCLEAAGDVGAGGPCDAQAEGRTPADRALQCGAGLLCFGDPDDPRQPGAALDGQGQCTALCDPRDAQCGEGSACVDFSSVDDPATDFDETTHIGVCLPSDCDVLSAENVCPEGQGCRPYAVTTTVGVCSPAGAVGSGGACASSDDCAGAAICGNNGVLEQACLPMCDPSAEVSCGAGEACFAQPGWLVGFCVPA